MSKLKYLKEYYDFTAAYQFDDGFMVVKNADLYKFRDKVSNMDAGAFNGYVEPYFSGRFKCKEESYFDTLSGKLISITNDTSKEKSDDYKKFKDLFNDTEED